MGRERAHGTLLALALVLAGAGAASAQDAPPTLSIQRAAGAITVDGDLSDPGWQGVAAIETWYETNPGDNVAPSVKNVGYLAYDDKFFYAAFRFQDPSPRSIRAPLGDRDNVPSYTDYAGVILDTRNTGKTAILFLANPHGIQYDAVTDDATGEDSSPDFYWDAVGRVTAEGWTLELRIPFSSLRYSKGDPQTWRIMLYRNYPRDFRTQMFSTTLPRGSSCFICRSNPLTGLRGLPSGGGIVAAPYVNASRTSTPRDGLGTPLGGALDATGGLDVKWRPGASTAIDATLNPDFSQIESDVAQIGANERFALFFPEKRPFFLEGIELFATPLQAVYTRTITDPRWGLRATGKLGRLAYTGFLAQDDGGGSVILPGPNSSDLVDQDFRSWVSVGRLRREFNGGSFASFLATDREIEGGGWNRVFGPDFQWRPSGRDTITGQLLFSRSLTPNRPDLTLEWDGRRLSSHDGQASWNHSTTHVDWYAQYTDAGDEFRADSGFIPQVGHRDAYEETGYTFRPKTGAVRRLRTFLILDRTTERDGGLVLRQVSPGFGLDGKWNSFVRLRYSFDRVRAGSVTLPRQQLVYTVYVSPSQKVSRIELEGFVGQEIDFDNARTGHGANVVLRTTLRPTDHLELQFNNNRRFLDVHAGADTARLFTARVDRLRATYTFTSRMFVRGIAQYVQTLRDPSLYADAVDRKEASFAASALFAYKLNWQTVLFLGYGDDRTFLEETDRLEREDRQLFLKISYAFQR
jgi:uncharacterized protein DUF5916